MRKRKSNGMKVPIISRVKDFLTNESQSVPVKLCQLGISVLVFIVALILGQDKDAGKVLFFVAFVLSGIDIFIKAILKVINAVIINKYLPIVLVGIIALAVGLYAEGVAAIILFQLGMVIIRSIEGRSRMSVSHLLELKPKKVKIVENGMIAEADVEKIMPGEAIIVGTGEFIPLDGVIRGGSGNLDTSIVTGRTIHKYVTAGDSVVAGCINKGETLTLEVTKTYCNSMFAKMIDMLIQAGDKKSDTERFVERVSKVYSATVVCVAVLLAILPPLISGNGFIEYIKRALSLIIIAYPCSMIISVPISYFEGIGTASKAGIIIRSGNAMDALSDIHTLVFDKTGTLTKGEFKVTDILPVEGLSNDGLLMIAAYAEQGSAHPIAKAIVAKYAGKIEQSRIQGYTVLSGSGVHTVIDGNSVYVGSDRLMRSKDVQVPDGLDEAVYVAVNEKYAGAILLSDLLKTEAPQTIRELKSLGVERTVITTGDREAKGKQVARELNIDQAFCELLPDEKAVEMEQLNKSLPKGRTMIFAGDGINDEPVIAIADAGIAMGGIDSELASETSDIVVMDGELRKIPLIVKLARYTRNIAKENIFFALLIKVLLIVLSALGISQLWTAVAVEPVVCLITVINSMRIMNYQLDLSPIDD